MTKAESLGLFLPEADSLAAQLRESGEHARGHRFDVLVCACAASPIGTPVVPALRHALQRELHVLSHRLAGRGRNIDVHRIPQHPLRSTPIRTRLHGGLLGGSVLIESRVGPYRRQLDAILDRARCTTPTSQFSIGSGGELLAPVERDGVPGILRIGRCGAASDPSHGFAALSELDALRDQRVSRPLDGGVHRNWRWTLESRLPGRRPERLTPSIVDQAVSFLERLPRDIRSPASLTTDLQTLTVVTGSGPPTWAELLADAEVSAQHFTGRLRHGDFWRGNLLVDGSRLSGVVDWDGWNRRSVPGTDLLQLLLTERRHRSKRSLGDLILERPWTEPQVAELLVAHLRRLGEAHDARSVDTVALAWWAAEVSGTLARRPALLCDQAWRKRNLDNVVRSARTLFQMR